MNQWKVNICTWSRCRREPRCRWRKSHRCSQPAGEEMVVDIEKCKGLRIRICTQVSQYRMLKVQIWTKVSQARMFRVQKSTKVSQAGQATPGGRRGWRCRAPPRCLRLWGRGWRRMCSWSCQDTPPWSLRWEESPYRTRCRPPGSEPAGNPVENRFIEKKEQW